MNVQKLESMAPEFHNLTEALKKTASVPSILLDKNGQPSPPKPVRPETDEKKLVSPEKGHSSRHEGRTEDKSGKRSSSGHGHHRSVPAPGLVPILAPVPLLVPGLFLVFQLQDYL